MKNPVWQRDELILALDLYFQLEPGQIDDRNPRIQELSHLLNTLPIHAEAERDQKFRNSDVVCPNLFNFMAAIRMLESGNELHKLVRQHSLSGFNARNLYSYILGKLHYKKFLW